MADKATYLNKLKKKHRGFENANYKIRNTISRGLINEKRLSLKQQKN